MSSIAAQMPAGSGSRIKAFIEANLLPRYSCIDG